MTLICTVKERFHEYFSPFFCNSDGCQFMMTIEEIIREVWPQWRMEREVSCDETGTVILLKSETAAGEMESVVRIIAVPDPNEMNEADFTPEQIKQYYQKIQEKYAANDKRKRLPDGGEHLVRIIDYRFFFLHEDQTMLLLLRMEPLVPLQSYLVSNRITEQETMKLGMDLCLALNECGWEWGKERNIEINSIFVDSDGNYKIIPSRFTAPFAYPSSRKTDYFVVPEDYHRTISTENASVAQIADIYTIGLILYWLNNEMRMPFLPLNKQILSAQERRDALERRLKGEVFPPPVRGTDLYHRIILKACQYSREKCFASAIEMYQALHTVYLMQYGQESQRKALSDNVLDRTIAVNTSIMTGQPPVVEPEKTVGIRWNNTTQPMIEKRKHTQTGWKHAKTNAKTQSRRKKGMLLFLLCLLFFCAFVFILAFRSSIAR